MAWVRLRTEAVRDYGLPQACLCCGNDEDDQLTLESFYDRSLNGTKVGCCLLSLFFGPVGWLLGLLVAASDKKKMPFSVPICQLCQKARSRLNTRAATILALAVVVGVGAGASSWVPGPQYVIATAVLVGIGALVECAYLSSQFNVVIRKSDADGVLLQTPNEEYPALYQRHLDNGVLYGSSDRLGQSSSDGLY